MLDSKKDYWIGEENNDKNYDAYVVNVLPDIGEEGKYYILTNYQYETYIYLGEKFQKIQDFIDADLVYVNEWPVEA
jgi:hypothetical protein